MIHSVRFTAVLDTNVIYPVCGRDLFLWLAYYELYTPKWSRNICEEWREVMIRKGVDPTEADKRVNRINDAFPDALVENYEHLLESLQLPDPKDRHILGAAIKTNANLIVTNNIKDFPTDYLCKLGLSAKSADDFLTDIIDLNPHKATSAFTELVLNKKNPPLSQFEVLEQLRKINLKNTADYLHALL